MHNIIEHEFEALKEEMEDPSFCFGKYLDEGEYEDEYCHNDIEDAKSLLEKKIRDYLKESRPSEFIVSNSWCVFVMTPERARKSRVSEDTIKDLLVR